MKKVDYFDVILKVFFIFKKRGGLGNTFSISVYRK